MFCCVCGLGSSVDIATGYGLDGPGFESRWGEVFRTCPDRPWGPRNLLYNGYQFFPWGKERPGYDADPLPPSSSMVKKEYSYTSTLPMDRTALESLSACTSVHFTLTLPVVCHRLKLDGQTRYLNVKLSVKWCEKIEKVSCGTSRFAAFECIRDYNEKLHLTMVISCKGPNYGI